MKKSDYTKALILLQSFETFWTFCSLSEGEIYSTQCKDVTKELISHLYEIFKTDKKIFNSKQLTLDSNDNTELIEGILNRLEIWTRNKHKLPYEGIFESNFQLSHLTMGLKIYLLRKVSPGIKIPIVWSSGETRFTKSRIRWGAHLPHHILKTIPDNLESELSNSKTIAVVGDIRKSQDLMTYSPSADFFRDRIIEFTQTSRKIIKDNYGIFDKFTGDGFLAYFNEEVCKKAGKDFIDCFIKCNKEIMDFAIDHFSNWTKAIRKLPLGSSGLTIGADIGKIEYKEIEGHLFAIGDTIVWANRVCSAGKSNEVILNNILYNLINDKHPKTKFEMLESVTKAGESFTAYKMFT